SCPGTSWNRPSTNAGSGRCAATTRSPEPLGSPVSSQRAPILDRDGSILFVARTVRSFGYGFLSVVLVLYLAAPRLDDVRIGLILGLTLLGDAGISLLLTPRADSIGRRRVLILGSTLIVMAGVLLVATSDFWVLVVAGTLGVVSVSGGEVGPFEAV